MKIIKKTINEMKQEFKDIYSKLSYCSHIPDQYYGHLITLSGMVFNVEKEKIIEIVIITTFIIGFDYLISTFDVIILRVGT